MPASFFDPTSRYVLLDSATRGTVSGPMPARHIVRCFDGGDVASAFTGDCVCVAAGLSGGDTRNSVDELILRDHRS